MKVSKEDYDNVTANDDKAIGITLSIKMGEYSAEQHFIAEDIEQEIGRVLGNMISQLSAIPDPEEPANRQLSAGTINKSKQKWREVIRA